MGTIVIEEYIDTGTDKNSDVQVLRLDKLIKRTELTGTNTTAASIALNTNTRVLRIKTDVAHRIASTEAATADGEDYSTTPEDQYYTIGVEGGQNFSYRTDV